MNELKWGPPLPEENFSQASKTLRYAMRAGVESMGNEALRGLTGRIGKRLEDIDASAMTHECLRYVCRLLFLLFLETKGDNRFPAVLRAVTEQGRREAGGFSIQDNLARMFHGMCGQGAGQMARIHILDPGSTPMLSAARLRNACLLQVLDGLIPAWPESTKQNPGESDLRINLLGAAYESLMDQRGVIATEDLYEVKKAGTTVGEHDAGYFVPERDLGLYTEEERVRYASGDRAGQLRVYPRGTYVYRMAGRDRDRSGSFYTPKSLTRCLVKYALEDLLKDKTADDILELTICEPSVGGASFLLEAVDQLAEAYLSRKEAEIGKIPDPAVRRAELQKVKVYITRCNVYGMDLNPFSVELAELALTMSSF